MVTSLIKIVDAASEEDSSDAASDAAAGAAGGRMKETGIVSFADPATVTVMPSEVHCMAVKRIEETATYLVVGERGPQETKTETPECYRERERERGEERGEERGRERAREGERGTAWR